MSRFLVIASLALLTQAGMAQSLAPYKGQPLNDAALDRITAGGVSAGISDGVVKFQGTTPTPNGLVSGAGTLAVLTGPITGSNMGTLTLNGGAQQNLSSLVNINAVNSNVNVLLNLNVNINSTVGSVIQSNLSGKH
ncbi:MAG: hypothetical protein JWQ49_753 [Edaphobacter sp.]|nr:hypothetical protein [Edaphobacter sp.]